jgi:glycosyltransferase involved in cell wall biosynthesis
MAFTYVLEFGGTILPVTPANAIHDYPLFCRGTRGRNRVSLIDISIVMATYRRPTSIVEAIRSILDQRDVRVEIFVIDDCPDGSAESVVVGIGDPRVHYRRNPNPSNGRPAIPRNVGWPLTQGEIIHFADDDDLVPEGLYADALAQFRRFPNIGLMFGSIEAFGEPSQRLVDEQALFARAAKRASRLQRLNSARLFAANLLFRDLLFVGGSTLIRRRCVQALGGLPTGAQIMEDVDFLARATRRFGVRYLNRPSLYYRVWPSIMHSQTDLQGAMNRSYRQLHAGYRETFGTFDFYVLKITARTLLRFV